MIRDAALRSNSGADANSSARKPDSWAFFGILSPHSGAGKTLGAIAEAVRATGQEVSFQVNSSHNLAAIFAQSRALLACRAEVVFVRYSPKLVLSIAVSALLARVQGRVFLLHVPTPVKVGLREGRGSRSVGAVVMKNLLARFAFPLAALAATLVVQNGVGVSSEPRWLVRKSILASNPSVGKAAPRDDDLSEVREEHALRAFGLSANSAYHGYDRLVRGLQASEARNPSIAVRQRIHLRLAGPRTAFTHEIGLLKRRPLRMHQVEFIGTIKDSCVQAMLRDADFAVGPLGTHRVGLLAGSALRNRDFLANLVPWVTSMPDIGMHDLNPDWIMEVAPSEADLEPDRIGAWFSALNLREARKEMLAIHAELAPDRFVQHLEGALSDWRSRRSTPDVWPIRPARHVE